MSLGRAWRPGGQLVRLLAVRSYYEGGNWKNEALGLGAIAGKQDRPAESLNYSAILAQDGLKPLWLAGCRGFPPTQDPMTLIWDHVANTPQIEHTSLLF